MGKQRGGGCGSERLRFWDATTVGGGEGGNEQRRIWDAENVRGGYGGEQMRYGARQTVEAVR